MTLGWGFITEGMPYWEEPFGTWLYDAEEDGNAELIENNGGYPNIWSVKAKIIPSYLAFNPEALPDSWVPVHQWDLS